MGSRTKHGILGGHLAYSFMAALGPGAAQQPSSPDCIENTSTVVSVATEAMRTPNRCPKWTSEADVTSGLGQYLRLVGQMPTGFPWRQFKFGVQQGKVEFDPRSQDKHPFHGQETLVPPF